ncbi:hypothetical protein PV-S19_0296 [Pacmanvirus S19]|nr:hypothetical protein PV-S19_0296 [Pacmanvirus S19]
MNSEFSLSDSSYVSVGGEDNQLTREVKEFAAKWVGGYPVFVLALLIVLVIVVLFLLFKKKESFMPTSTLRFQQRDGLGESMDSGADRAQSVFAQTAQDGSAAVPTSSAAVLASADFDCANRTQSTSDAWDWMNGVAHESMVGAPKNDNDFSRILAGQ